MKHSRITDGLQKSTKATLVVCSCILALTAATLLVLMFFPITPKERTVIVTPVLSATTPPPGETTAFAIASETVHTTRRITLSTWSANISGYSRSVEEFKNNNGGTTADPFATKPTVTKKATTAVMTAPAVSTSVTAQTSGVVDPNEPHTAMPEPVIPPSVTTTVQQVPQEDPMTAPPLPVQTDPPAPPPTAAPVPVEPDPEPAPAPVEGDLVE